MLASKCILSSLFARNICIYFKLLMILIWIIAKFVISVILLCVKVLFQLEDINSKITFPIFPSSLTTTRL